MSHTMTALQEENQRLKEEIHLLQHTAQHSQGQVQGGREGSPINVEEVIKVLRKYEEVVRTFGDKEVKLEETTPQNVVRCNILCFCSIYHLKCVCVCVCLIDVHVQCILVTCINNWYTLLLLWQ